jgi:NAD(P)-dependent dehydrogenase (short-subunit alcohol dehydrogenase family)
MKLNHKVALITGAGRGIGRCIALALAEEGSDVILTARSIEQLEAVAQEVESKGRRALPIPCDVSIPQEVKTMARRVEDEFGHLNILVINAGISKRSRILEYEDDTWLEVLRVNLFGAYLTTKALLPMIQKVGQGRIIMMASIAGKLPVPFNTAYSASKHGLLGLTKSLASEMALSGFPGITVNAICPFFVQTEMFTGPEGYLAQMSKNYQASESEIIARAMSGSLQQRVLDPEEIASLAVYLCSDGARGITGQAINICGGRAFH